MCVCLLVPEWNNEKKYEQNYVYINKKIQNPRLK